MPHTVIRAFACITLLTAATLAMPSMAQSYPPPAQRGAELQSKLDQLAAQALPARLGIAVLDLSNGQRWRVNTSRGYPMMSVFKAPVAATVLSRVDRGELSLDQSFEVIRADWQQGSAVPSIGARFHGDHMRFSLRELLFGAVSQSDNTAVNALLRLLGGPATVTDFLRQHGIQGMRVDLDEHGVSTILYPTEPTGETAADEELRLHRGYQAYLVDPRNTSTPDAAINFLRELDQGRLLSPASTRQLLAWMAAQTKPNRLRAGTPSGVSVADKCGTTATFDGRTAAYNDIAILHWPDGHDVLIAAFLSDAATPQADRDALFAKIAQEVALATHPAQTVTRPSNAPMKNLF